MPHPPRRRRGALAALAVLLIVGGAAAAGLLAVRIDERVPVIVAARDIPVGAQLTADDLRFARVASEGLDLIPASRANEEVIGRYTGQAIPAGRLIDHSMINGSGLLRKGSAAVGVTLKAGRAPASELQSGDVVQVVRAVEGKAEILTQRGVIGLVRTPQTGTFGSGGGDPVATVIVPQADAAAIAAAAAADQIVLVLLERGGAAGAG